MERVGFNSLAEWKSAIVAWKKRADGRLVERSQSSVGEFPRLIASDAGIYKASIAREYARLCAAYNATYATESGGRR